MIVSYCLSLLNKVLVAVYPFASEEILTQNNIILRLLLRYLIITEQVTTETFLKRDHVLQDANKQVQLTSVEHRKPSQEFLSKSLPCVLDLQNLSEVPRSHCHDGKKQCRSSGDIFLDVTGAKSTVYKSGRNVSAEVHQAETEYEAQEEPLLKKSMEFQCFEETPLKEPLLPAETPLKQALLPEEAIVLGQEEMILQHKIDPLSSQNSRSDGNTSRDNNNTSALPSDQTNPSPNGYCKFLDTAIPRDVIRRGAQYQYGSQSTISLNSAHSKSADSYSIASSAGVVLGSDEDIADKDPHGSQEFQVEPENEREEKLFLKQHRKC